MKAHIQRTALTTREKRQISVRLVQTTIDESLRALRLGRWSVEVELISNRQMRVLNRRYRGRDSSTDVLSFPLFEALRGKVLVPAWATGHPLGTVVIARETAIRQAKAFGHPLFAEVVRLLVHGIVHLAGYDHERSPRDERLMFAVEDRILRRLRHVLK
jgi:probable rRNA maturation factor